MACRIVVFALIAWVLLTIGASATPSECPSQPLRKLTQSELDQIIAAHQQWLATRNDPVPQGTQADLSWTNLETLSFKGANLTAANLEGADLTSAKFDSGTVFDESQMDCAVLTSASGPPANSPAPTVHFFQTNLRDAKLVGAVLPLGRFVGADLSGAELSEADFTKADFGKAIFTDATMNGTTLTGADLKAAGVQGAVWQTKGSAPDVATLDEVSGLASLQLDPDQYNTGGLRVLLKALRDARFDLRANEVAHSLGSAEAAFHLSHGSWSLGAFETVFFGLGSDYTLDRVRPWWILLLGNAIFFPVYLILGFRAHANRLVPESAPGSNLANVAGPRRWILAGLFWLRTTVAVGIGQINLPHLLGLLIPSINSIKAIGRLAYVANLQTVVSTLLFAHAVYLALFNPLG